MGRACIAGVNDLATNFPLLAAEWHPSKNGDLSPSEVTSFSAKSIWWVCPKGHEWEASAYDRVHHGRKCVLCINTRNGSLADRFPETIAIWHPTKNGNLTPHDIAYGSKRIYWWQCENGHEVEAFPRNVIKGLKCVACKNGSDAPDRSAFHSSLHPTKNAVSDISQIIRKSTEILVWVCEHGHEWNSDMRKQINCGFTCPQCMKSLVATEPKLAALFHPTKNGELSIYDLTKKTYQPLWWECENGHEWESTWQTLRDKGSECTFCKTSIVATHPEIAALWHPTKNALDVKYFTEKKSHQVWWQCEHGHEWEETFQTLRRKNGECGACKHAVICGDPELLSLWHEEKNGSMNNSVAAIDVVWWKCGNGHEWKSTYRSLEKHGGCKFCHRSLSHTNPEIAALWHPTKNDGISPYHVAADGFEGVWWLCESGHEWFSRVRNFNHNCEAFAAAQEPVSKPAIATSAESVPLLETQTVPTKDLSKIPVIWDAEKNEGLALDLMQPKSITRVNWTCSNGHSWIAGFAYQQKKMDSCKKCRVSLLAVNPSLAALWHPTRNADLAPLDVAAKENIRVWWKCAEDHEWKSSVAYENSKEEHCKFC